MPDLKPNSHQYRQEEQRRLEGTPTPAPEPKQAENDISDKEKTESEKPKKELSGGVRTKKRSLGRRFMDIFFKDGASPSEIKTYLIEEVLVPSVLENIADAINAAVEMRFFGEARRVRRGKSASGSNSRTAYGSFYSGGELRRERMARSTKEQSTREALEDIVFDTLRDAEQVRDDMLEILENYPQVTVADYKDILSSYGISVKQEHTDNKYGWTDLSEVVPRRARGGGYYLDLPREYRI